MPTPTLLQKVKAAMRITSSSYDSTIEAIIGSAKLDLGIAGITLSETPDDLCLMAIITYCRAHFGTPSDYDKLVASYNEQKAQLQMATGYGFPAEAGDDDG